MEADRELVHDQAFNVGRTEENYRIRDVAEIVDDVVAGSKIAFADSAGPDLRNYRVNCDKLAETIPAYDPRWTVRTGVEQLKAAFEAVQLTPDDITSAKLQRIEHIKAGLASGALTSDLRPVDLDDPRRRRPDGGHHLLPLVRRGRAHHLPRPRQTPLADALVPADTPAGADETFPLAVAFCPHCSLVQITEEVPPEKLFVDNYLYFSSFSDHLLRHSREQRAGPHRAPGPRPRQPRGRGGQQRRLPAQELRRGRHPRARHRPGARPRRRPPRPTACPRSPSSSGSTSPSSWRPSGAGPT